METIYSTLFLGDHTKEGQNLAKVGALILQIYLRNINLDATKGLAPRACISFFFH